MPASNYLDGETDLYGLPAMLPAGLAEQASAIVDNELKRPEGLIYVADRNGFPAFMKSMSPSFIYKLAGPISPGQNVIATVTPANARQDLVGEALVLDRVTPDLLETVVVSAVTAPGMITLKNVQFAHAVGTNADVGLVISEERSPPAKRSIVRYSKFPCVSILSLMGRYSYGRRSDQIAGLNPGMNILTSVQVFGGPQSWASIDINQTSWSDQTGEIWIPAGILMSYYSDVKIKYVAGFPKTPHSIVKATAAIAQSLSASGTYGAGIKTIAAGDSRIERFGSSNIDDSTRQILSEFKARTFY